MQNYKKICPIVTVERDENNFTAAIYDIMTALEECNTLEEAQSAVELIFEADKFLVNL